MNRQRVRPRLCMIVHASYPLDVRVAREARVAVTAGYDVDVIALREPGEPKREVVDGVRVFRLPVSHRRGVGVAGVLREYLGFTVLASLRAAELAVRRRHEIVQVHNPPDFLILAAVVPRLLGAHVILDIHDLSPDMFAMRFEGRRGAGVADSMLRRIESWATRSADSVITVHEPYRRELVARSVPPEKTAVVMNSLDEGLLPSGSPSPEPPGFRVVYHGTITPPYGVQLIVEAAAQLSGSIPDIRLDLYGEGDSLPGIRELARELGITEHLHVSGRYLPQVEVLERVRGASVGVIPNLATRLNRFALSSKLFEYVALEIPVVCADLPTIREHFADDEVLFFRAGDAASLAEALRAVAESPEAAAARAGRALRRYRRDYRWEANARRYVDVLDRFARGEPTPPPAPEPRVPRPALAAESPADGRAAFEVSEPFLFFDHFRLPSRVVAPGESVLPGGVPEGHPLRQLAQLGWAERDRPGAAPRIYWPSAQAGPAAVKGMLPAAEYRIGSTPIYGRLLPDAVSAPWFDDAWTRSVAVTGPTGAPAASIWRDSRGSIFLPFDPSEVILNYWSEAYRDIAIRRLSRSTWELGRRSYYRLRPALPRGSQLAFRRLLTHLQTRTAFPRWPYETALNDFYEVLFGCVVDVAPGPVPWIAPWPNGHEWALVLTHDVETAAGLAHVPHLSGIERSLGYRSSFNFVPKRYRVEDALVSSLHGEGFEIGVHGLHHDGRDFESLALLTQRLPEMRRYAERWQATGFRSPATHRTWGWMPRLEFDYDSSYPDTDPFEPYAGGCCSWLPFFNEQLVELPITLPQDHTLFTILGHTDESLWLDKIDRLKRAQGMALLLTHPDYMLDEQLADAYTRLLERFAEDATAWRALPREVSAWWRRRAASNLTLSDDGWRVVGPAAGEAVVSYAGGDRPARPLALSTE